MLRIKADKWQEFCERAEELGFMETIMFDEAYHQFCSANGNIDIYDRYVEVEIVDNDNECLNKLYDLITMGFVEKVE